MYADGVGDPGAEAGGAGTIEAAGGANGSVNTSVTGCKVSGQSCYTSDVADCTKGTSW